MNFLNAVVANSIRHQGHFFVEKDMKKIKCLFERDYTSGLVYDKVTEGAEWVLEGEGWPTVKLDGTCCMVRNGQLFKRYDRKLTKSAYRRKKDFKNYKVEPVQDFKPAPHNWEPCEPEPNIHTGHWPGWAPVCYGPEDQWHREAWEKLDTLDLQEDQEYTYELVGPKIQGNPYCLTSHSLWLHGTIPVSYVPRDFEGIKGWLEENEEEGIVWHNIDGRMIKIRRKDFGLEWPVKDK
jgi:hypothetical protein